MATRTILEMAYGDKSLGSVNVLSAAPVRLPRTSTSTPPQPAARRALRTRSQAQAADRCAGEGATTDTQGGSAGGN